MKTRVESLKRKARTYEVDEFVRMNLVRTKKKTYIVFYDKETGRLTCDCMHSSLHPKMLCSHKVAVLMKKGIKIDDYHVSKKRR